VRLKPHLPDACSDLHVFRVASSNSQLLSKTMGRFSLFSEKN